MIQKKVKDIFQAQCVSELGKIMKDDTVEEPLDLDEEAFLEDDIKALETKDISYCEKIWDKTWIQRCKSKIK